MHLFMLCLACRTFVMEWCLAVAQTFCCGPDLLPRNAHLLGEKDRDTACARERGGGKAVKGRVGRGGGACADSNTMRMLRGTTARNAAGLHWGDISRARATCRRAEWVCISTAVSVKGARQQVRCPETRAPSPAQKTSNACSSRCGQRSRPLGLLGGSHGL